MLAEGSDKWPTTNGFWALLIAKTLCGKRYNRPVSPTECEAIPLCGWEGWTVRERTEWATPIHRTEPDDRLEWSIPR